VRETALGDLARAEGVSRFQVSAFSSQLDFEAVGVAHTCRGLYNVPEQGAPEQVRSSLACSYMHRTKYATGGPPVGHARLRRRRAHSSGRPPRNSTSCEVLLMRGRPSNQSVYEPRPMRTRRVASRMLYGSKSGFPMPSSPSRWHLKPDAIAVLGPSPFRHPQLLFQGQRTRHPTRGAAALKMVRLAFVRYSPSSGNLQRLGKHPCRSARRL